jgi:flagellar hook-associated protein 1 FlgK
MLQKLNLITEAFANEFNEIHKTGYALGADTPSGKNFFEFTAGDAAKTIKVNQDILDDSELLAAAAIIGGTSGDNENAKNLADVLEKNFVDYKTAVPEGLNGSFVSFYSGMIGRLGVDSQSAQKDLKNSLTLAISVETNRQSVSSVSLDEEMTNMIKFQQAYNSSARMITVLDEMLDRVVNGIGLGGR